MLLALQNAVVELLKSGLPSLFTGAGAASVAFVADAWQFDPSSADPVAGEPGPEDAVDQLAFVAANPSGPYLLTRPPYGGQKRVYLRSSAGELSALASSEVAWDATNPARFTLQPRVGRELAAFDHLEIQYSVIAAAARLKTLHQFTLEISAADAARAEQALALALAVLNMNRISLLAEGGFSFNADGYGAQAAIKALKFVAGAAPGALARRLALEVEVDLRLERQLGDDEGKPIEHIVSPGKAASSKAIDIDPAVQA